MEYRELKFQSFDDAVAYAETLQLQGYERAGQWDLAQVLDHLTYFLDGAVNGYSFKVPWIIKAMFGKMVLRRILTSKRMKRGVFTPQKPLPEPNLDSAAALVRFKHAVDRLTRHEGEYKASPFFGVMTRDQVRELNLLHCRHHLGYLTPKG